MAMEDCKDVGVGNERVRAECGEISPALTCRCSLNQLQRSQWEKTAIDLKYECTSYLKGNVHSQSINRSARGRFGFAQFRTGDT